MLLLVLRFFFFNDISEAESARFVFKFSIYFSVFVSLFIDLLCSSLITVFIDLEENADFYSSMETGLPTVTEVLFF